MTGSLMCNPVIFDNPFAFEQPVFVIGTVQWNVANDSFAADDDYSSEFASFDTILAFSI